MMKAEESMKPAESMKPVPASSYVLCVSFRALHRQPETWNLTHEAINPKCRDGVPVQIETAPRA